MELVGEGKNYYTLKLEEGENIYLETPQGMVAIFISANYKKITSWVKDTEYHGFYTKKTSKKIISKKRGNHLVELKRVE